MSRAFGVIEGRAAIVKAGGPLYVVSCDSEQSIRIAREALNQARAKLPCATRIVFQKAAPATK
jgi:ribosomal protein L16/L10AE